MATHDSRRWALAAVALACGCGAAPSTRAAVVPEAQKAAQLEPAARVYGCGSVPMLSASPAIHESSVPEVVRVDTRGSSDPDKVCRALETRPGALLDEAIVDKDVHALWDTGLFDDIEVSREDAPGGVALTFAVKPRAAFASVRLDGVRGIDGVDDKLLPAPGLLDSYRMHQAKRALLDELAFHGYRRADVSYSLERQEDGTSQLVFNVDARARTLVGKLAFRGLGRLKEQELTALLGTRPGAPLSEEVLARDVFVVVAACYDHGMVMAQVDEPTVVESQSGEVADVTFDVREGDVYRIGAVHVAGDLLQPEADYLRSFWSSKPNDVFDRAVVMADIGRIREYHEGRGFPSAVDPDTTLHPDKKTLDITLKISPEARR